MRRLFVIGCLLVAGPPAFSADAWHLSGWQGRAIVEIPKPLTETGVDTAVVRILCQGLAKADGSDYRVLDAAGKPVPFQLTFHDAARYALLSFRATNPKQRFFVYFGNPQATAPKEQVIVKDAPGSGPPKGDWVPHYGLVLETMQRPVSEKELKARDVNHPKTVADMAKLMAGSKQKFGARYQRRISDGYNPFDRSDFYISVYRGWMNIPKAGTYQFCTVSSKASFSFLDGKELIHWPGRHTTDRGARGEVNEAVQLTAGLHYIEYYHETAPIEHMAFLGWRPSADMGQFSAIPENIFTAPHAGVVKAYEQPKGPLLRWEAEIADSSWPVERTEGQYTRCRFQVEKTSAMPSGTTFQWEFGDGQTATGAEVEHVYLTLGTYPVTLTAKHSQGNQTVRWPLRVFEIEHVTEQFKEGPPKEYAKMALKYDLGKLSADPLRELAHLLAENEQPADAVKVGKEYIQRFGDKPDLAAARVRRLMADCAIQLGRGGIKEAIANYKAALVPEMEPQEKLDVLARLIRLLGIERSLPDEADKIMVQVKKAWEEGTNTRETKAAYRRALIAMGDVLLWNKKLADANDFYRRSEGLGAFIPSQVRKARIGAYPNSIRKYIEGGNYGAALDIVNRWDESFPTDKPNGQTFFWRGKLLALRGQHNDAARYLARTLGLSVGAGYESEARWLLAEALEKIGRGQDARRELARLIASGVKDKFSELARAKLRKD